jgi:hypothetical protein
MTEAEQKDLDGKAVPNVSKDRETKEYDVYHSKHLVLKIGVDAAENFFEKLNKIKDEDEREEKQRLWIQSKIRIRSPVPIDVGVWDKESQELYDEFLK